MKTIGLLMTSLLLMSCATKSYEGNENSPYYPVPAGSTLTLTRALTIPANQVAVFLQGGAVAEPGRVDQYYPHCKFELHRRLDTAQTVQPDSFRVAQVKQEIGHSVALEGVQLAGVSFGIGINIGLKGGDGSSLQAWSTRLTLDSARQPQVFRLSCGQAALPNEGQHLSINEMRKVLGSIFTLELAGRPPATGPRP